MDGNAITSVGASALFDVLGDCCPTLGYLSLEKNKLDDKCMDSLGRYIQEYQTLRTLTLSGNQITDEGIKVLIPYLTGNGTLNSLFISDHREITDESVRLLCDIIHKTVLTSVNLWSTSVSRDLGQSLRAMLNISHDKREILIKSNAKSAAKIQS